MSGGHDQGLCRGGRREPSVSGVIEKIQQIVHGKRVCDAIFHTVYRPPRCNMADERRTSSWPSRRRDAQDLISVDATPRLEAFVRLAATRTGQELNLAGMSNGSATRWVSSPRARRG